MEKDCNFPHWSLQVEKRWQAENKTVDKSRSAFEWEGDRIPKFRCENILRFEGWSLEKVELMRGRISYRCSTIQSTLKTISFLQGNSHANLHVWAGDSGNMFGLDFVSFDVGPWWLQAMCKMWPFGWTSGRTTPNGPSNQDQ